MTIEKLRERLEAEKTRSAWDGGVYLYAHDLLDDLEEAILNGYFQSKDITNPKLLEEALLNGAKDWKQYSWGGCSLCYDWQIAKRLCNPSELKKTRNGERRPNSREEWLDVQARALWQAYWLIRRVIDKAVTGC